MGKNQWEMVFFQNLSPLAAVLGLLMMPAMAVGLNDPAGYAEISEVNAEPLEEISTSSDECTQRCDQMVECKGVKFTHGALLLRGACTLLGAKTIPEKAVTDLYKLQGVAQAKVRAVQQQAKHQVEAIESRTAQAKKQVDQTETSEEINREHRTLSAVIHPPLPDKQEQRTQAELMSTVVKNANEAELQAEREQAEIKKEMESTKAVPGPTLVQEVLAAQQRNDICKHAKTLHVKYIGRVKHEVERDQAKKSANIEDTLNKEIDRANRIVERRAKREARSDMRLDGPELEHKVMAMLEKGGGQKIAQRFLQGLKKNACTQLSKVKLSEVPRLNKVDSWDNCNELESHCKMNVIEKNCAATCN